MSMSTIILHWILLKLIFCLVSASETFRLEKPHFWLIENNFLTCLSQGGTRPNKVFYQLWIGIYIRPWGQNNLLWNLTIWRLFNPCCHPFGRTSGNSLYIMPIYVANLSPCFWYFLWTFRGDDPRFHTFAINLEGSKSFHCI